MNDATIQSLRSSSTGDCSRVYIRATDGYNLAADILYPSDSRKIKKVVIVAGATGVRKERYHAYSRYLMSRGWTVINFDYRGIGGSLAGPVTRVQGTMLDWGSKDLAGIIEWVRHYHQPERLVVVGHSVGGQITPFAANHEHIDALLAICAQNSYWKLWDGRKRFMMCGLWYVFSRFLGRRGNLDAHETWPMGEVLVVFIDSTTAEACCFPHWATAMSSLQLLPLPGMAT